MRYTVSALHKALGKLIEEGQGRKIVCVDKESFQHPCEGDGSAVILELAGLGIKWVQMADDDGGIKVNKDGTESGRTFLVLAGGSGANAKGELVECPLISG